jgi:RNA polymerase sigma-70 factor, ECF subfamily
LREFMTTTELGDELVAAACAGDGDALRTVYESLAPKVLGYLRSHGVSDPEATTSDVFLAVLPKLGELHGGAAGLRTLVFSVAHARMVDDHRSQARKPPTVDYVPTEDVRPVPSAEEEAMRALSAGWVHAVLDLLPADQREVLRLRVIADLSLVQVAQIIGRSEGAVKQLQRRALVSLRAALADRRVTR